MLKTMKVDEFVNKTASKEPVPGGGSVAALAGSLAGALIEMVANLTVDKKGYEDVNDEMKEIISKISKLKDTLVDFIDKDANAFDDVMKGFKMPKETEEEKKIRSEFIQNGYKKAANVPLEVAKTSLKVLLFTKDIVNKGNKNAVTDGLVAAMMARTAVLGALYNVKINLSSIKDEAFVLELKDEINNIENKAISFEQEVLNLVDM
ncbi:MAG: cyclodeaminase/cyclohydrolase family protein [Peptostreptococcaceae bacterium]|nr:cyclodeaminase/cyclohydrolase family protein [Peptostreptococcaceae bacterium]